MNEEVTNKARELYDNLMYFPNKVLGIFNDFFGEDKVDMQAAAIILETYIRSKNAC